MKQQLGPRRARCWVLALLAALALAAASCGGGGGGGGGSGGGFSTADYQFLYTYNAVLLSGHTIRWANVPIAVSFSVDGTQAAFNRWNSASSGAVSFSFGTSGNITVDWTDSNSYCGVTFLTWSSNGRMTSARVLIARNQAGCAGGADDTLAHEAGHAIGFIGHDSSGLMNPFGGQAISTQEARFMRLLYSLAPGTDINGFLKLQTKQSQSKYDASGQRSYSMTIY
ncbi:MAG: hypothetical protein C4525_12825 [Desulfarculus sp.]|nr:MAG: hypothetical protein C4525_12825 [Desulfarculus sp.]